MADSSKDNSVVMQRWLVVAIVGSLFAAVLFTASSGGLNLSKVRFLNGTSGAADLASENVVSNPNLAANPVNGVKIEPPKVSVVVPPPVSSSSTTPSSGSGISAASGSGSITVTVDITDPSAEISVAYRFWSDIYRRHFYTVSAAERDAVSLNPNWSYEGTSFKVSPEKTCTSGRSPIYRFWSDKFKGHFYTISEGEKDYLVAHNPDWRLEGVAYCANRTPITGTIPLYRFWSDNYKGHFYTISEPEKSSLQSNPNWKYEAIAYYVYPKS